MQDEIERIVAVDGFQFGEIGNDEVLGQLVQLLVRIILRVVHLIFLGGQGWFEQVELRDKVLRICGVKQFVTLVVQSH